MRGKSQLLFRMLGKGLLGLLLLGVLLFGCAGSLRYENAWIFLGVLALLMLIMGLVLLIRHPETLERRLHTKETEAAQKHSLALSGVAFLLSFALAGFDYRFQWVNVPFGVSIAALIVMCIGYMLYAVVIFQNAYASRVVEVQEGQSVISTGLYAVVRHPLYLASLLVFLPIPVILGSWVALIPMILFPISLALRIRNEEAVLQSGLEGYAAYMKKTKYRLIPYIW